MEKGFGLWGAGQGPLVRKKHLTPRSAGVYQEAFLVIFH